jgi:hypothetical protein
MDRDQLERQAIKNFAGNDGENKDDLRALLNKHSKGESYGRMGRCRKEKGKIIRN